jgi:hypothetical protein
MKVGDKVFLARMGSWDMHFIEATIVKITPSGMVDAQIGTSEPMRFRPSGERYHSDSKYHDYSLDSKLYEERRALLDQEDRAKMAAQMMNDLYVADRVKYTYGKDWMLSEVKRLRELLDAAERQVEAI